MSGYLQAPELFAPIAPTYERWASILSLGQDARWRRDMVQALDPKPGDLVLDVAAGTGSITRLLQARGAAVISVDRSAPMLSQARGATAALATAEQLPFRQETFQAVTFGYLLRYVASVEGALGELARVLKPGGRMGMVEFGRPAGAARAAWTLYTRAFLPIAGTLVGGGWQQVGAFLGPSISQFSERFPPFRMRKLWETAGLVDVHLRPMSLGGGLVMWGTKP